jgi:membrane fusion protein (multidrug efflux system)
VDLRATIPNPQRTLLPGMYVTLTANLGQQHKVFLLPQAAVQRDTTGAYAMVVGADGKVARKDITTTDMRDGQWVVNGGLAAGDQVVVSGLQKVKPGAPAKATPWQPDAPAGSKPAGKAPTQAPTQAPSGK